jgi:hypothetical protein
MRRTELKNARTYLVDFFVDFFIGIAAALRCGGDDVGIRDSDGSVWGTVRSSIGRSDASSGL